MLTDAGFRQESACVGAWRATLDTEQPVPLDARLMHRQFRCVADAIKRIIPILIYRIERTPQ